ncbi:MAG TPA: hypothetical protein VFY75_04085 [Solirubrobacterales bacterium]|nr:hypothetical protein [Solirubrobacterales bacterium]
MTVRARARRDAGTKRLAVAAIAALLMLFAADRASAQPPFEPNDSLLTAAGPLANNTTYTAADETENDVDYFYFYVTTPSTAQLTFTLTNLGGGFSEPYVWGEITESHGYEIAELESVRAANYDTTSISLEAGKYYFRVQGGSGYGASYKFTTSGTDGAFGDFAAIAARCAAATGPVNTYQSQLATAQANLRRAQARWNKVRYSRNRKAKRRARAKLQRTKETVAAEKQSLKAAEAGQKPWCFIPQ